MPDMRRLAAVVLPVAIVLALTVWRSQGPSPKPATVAGSEFSAQRAVSILHELLAEQTPHPVATDANRRIRDRVVARFRALGYETAIQPRFVCNAMPACASVENILAEDTGSRGAAVALVAHYDSVGAGPGASDDGAGVATLLEIARAVRGEQHRNPILFLVTDGEESGLLGAEAFTADQTLSRNVKAVINVENRGTYGPSNLFETSRNNRWLIRRLARALPRPNGSSFLYAIYTILPNDTDVSVFKRDGKAAVNFAAIRGVNAYHTPLDDLAHADARMLQHHGDNLLAAARALADADLDAQSGDDASYFDVLQLFMVWWPAGLTPWICAASLILLVFSARAMNARAMTFGVLATFTTVVLSLIAGILVARLAGVRAGGINWLAHPAPSVSAMWLTGIAAALFSAALFRKRSDGKAMLFGAAFVWHAIAFVLAITITGASFLFLVPAIAVMLCAVFRASETTISAVSSASAGLALFPVVTMLYDALGGRMIVTIAILVGMMATLSAPLWGRFRTALAAGLLAVIAAGVAIAVPASSPERPRPISIAYLDDATAAPVWVTNVLTPRLARAASFRRAPRSLTPWYDGTQWSAPAPRLAVPRVEMSAVRNGDRVTVVVRSPRHANRLTLAVRNGTVLSVNGVAPAAGSSRRRRRDSAWRFAHASGVDSMTIELRAHGRLELIASDISFGLAAPALQRARDLSNAVPQHDGDVEITRVRAQK